jgi:hypothetical protein
VANRAGHDGPAQEAVTLKAEEQLGDALRRLGADQTAANAESGEICLVACALRELGGALDQTLGVQSGVDDGLWVEVDDGTPPSGLIRLGKVASGRGVIRARGMPTRTDPKLFVILAGNAPLADDAASSVARSNQLAAE